ncbi:hypothetical protein C6P46_006850 [Rhodotorula mucilaginosa]|uniref:Coenzyme Q-binding protein COQ10 START domain-containing protein n=1 Tax=Rhodotorula mucilaginosa TaxID=5537 RepID=A0A9P7B9D7_RHOMI|nr:hypothetical protein C6P46_006850 [Rhodotorula mucilaginosa]
MASTAARRTVATAARRQTPACARSFFSLPGFPSPFGSSASLKPAPDRKGTLVKEGDIWVYREDKVMPYSPAQLYSVIADVDSYQSFLPFTTASRVLNSTSLDPSGQRRDRPVTEKGWLRPGAGERWEMDAELRIGAMGFEEGYVSRVEAEKERWVKATSKDASMFRHLSTIWSFSPAPPTPQAAAPQTRVDLYLAYAFASPIHAAAIQTVWDKVSALMVEKFEQRVREVHGTR